jgi:antitoxin VapB
MPHIGRFYRTRLYRNGTSQAVRIPKELAFPEDIEVELIRRGDEVIVRPAERRLTGLGEALRRMGDAMHGFRRDDGEHQERDWPAGHQRGDRG